MHLPLTREEYAKRIFLAGIRYEAVGANLEANPAFMAQSVTNVAFAIELYFKSLIVMETDAPLKKHNYVDLFNALPARTRHELVAFHNSRWHLKPGARYENGPYIDVDEWNRDHDFDKYLEEFQDAFVIFRYSYEGRWTGFGGHFLARPLKHVIYARKPAWFAGLSAPD